MLVIDIHILDVSIFCQSDRHCRSFEHRLRPDPQGKEESQRGEQHGTRRRCQRPCRNSRKNIFVLSFQGTKYLYFGYEILSLGTIYFNYIIQPWCLGGRAVV